MPELHQFEQSTTIEVRVDREATNLRQQAHGMPAGIRRDELLRKARQADTAAHMSEWLRSPGLRPPE